MKKNKKKENKIYKYVKLFIGLIFFVISIILSVSLIKTKMLPNKYLILVIIILLFINLLCDFMLFVKKKAVNVISIILIILFSVTFIIGVSYVNKTINIIENIINVEEERSTYYVLVIKDKNYNNVNDLVNEKVGILEQNADSLLKSLENKVTLNYDKYDTAGNLVYGLELNEVAGIIISSTVYDLILEENDKFADMVKKIGEVEVVGKPEIVKSSIEVGKSFILYISGLDTRNTKFISPVGLSDVNILAVVNPTTHNVLLIHIPRDYYVQLHGKSGLKDKLTHSGLYGIETSLQTVEDLFDININAYVKVNFKALTSVVDAIDGIDVYSDTRFNSYHKKGWVVKKGWNYMDGEKALAYTRERYAYKSGDRHRGQNQTDVMAAIIKKISANKKYLLKYDVILNSVQPYIATNVELEDIQDLVKNQLDTMSSWNVTNIAVDGSDGRNYTASFPKQLTYVMTPSQKTIDDAKNKINQVMRGE